VAIALVAVVAIVIAIPVFLSHQPPANRNVVLPATLIDQQRLSNPTLDASVAQEISLVQQAIPGGSQAQAAYYGADGEATFMVAAGKLARRPTPGDVKTFFSSTGTTSKLTLTKMGSGPFGGTLECGTLTAAGESATTCGSIDSAAAILVVAKNTTPSQLAIVTREIVSSIEQKG
jgi:hypothetical protein